MGARCTIYTYPKVFLQKFNLKLVKFKDAISVKNSEKIVIKSAFDLKRALKTLLP